MVILKRIVLKFKETLRFLRKRFVQETSTCICEFFYIRQVFSYTNWALLPNLVREDLGDRVDLGIPNASLSKYNYLKITFRYFLYLSEWVQFWNFLMFIKRFERKLDKSYNIQMIYYTWYSLYMHVHIELKLSLKLLYPVFLSACETTTCFPT